MLKIRELSAGYSGNPVLHDISFSAETGSVTAIVGPNGCGKSTLLKAICGILPPSSGRILFREQSLQALPRKQLAQTVAYLSQSRQVPEITAGRLVLHGRFPYLHYPRHYRPEDLAAAEAAMEAMDVLPLKDTPLAQLSGGQRQKVYLAMALAQDTPVVLLDEPTTYLDVAQQLQLLRYARALADQGKTVVMVIHDLTLALGSADRLLVLKDGQNVGFGTAEDVYSSRILEDVFGVSLHRFPTPVGWHYYCQEC